MYYKQIARKNIQLNKSLYADFYLREKKTAFLRSFFTSISDCIQSINVFYVLIKQVINDVGVDLHHHQNCQQSSMSLSL